MKCEEHKKLTEFYKRTNSKDGLFNHCKTCKNADTKRWQEKNAERNKANIRRWQKENAERNEANIQRWQKENAEQHKRNKRRYMRARRKADPNFRILHNLRTRLYGALKGNTKSESTMALVGCDIDYLWDYLIAQFTEGMTVENYGKWHVDHIRPCASFDLEDQEQQRECFYYKNLQPLWAEDNLSKGDRYDG